MTYPWEKPEKTKILITGGTGNLGQQLKRVFPGALAPTRNELDLRDMNAVDMYIGTRRPDVIVHAGALTGIRPCEENRELAWKTNALGTENLVNAALLSKPHTYFVYVSTACVFDGFRGPYTEDDVPYPKNFYALTKLAGEYAVRLLPKSLVVRTNFVGRQRWPHPRAFVDRWGTYLFADDVARGIRDVVEADLTGTVHVVGDRRISQFDLARLTSPDVKPMSLENYDGPPLTVDMCLDTVRWHPYTITERLTGAEGPEGASDPAAPIEATIARQKADQTRSVPVASGTL